MPISKTVHPAATTQTGPASDDPSFNLGRCAARTRICVQSAEDWFALRDDFRPRVRTSLYINDTQHICLAEKEAYFWLIGLSDGTKPKPKTP